MAISMMKPIHSLVIDAGPIIKNDPPVSTLLGQSEALYTVPAVIEEIRDANTRSRIETNLVPFLKLRTPKAGSCKIVSDYARRTGDLEVLSRPDLQILALAYELECERNHGDWRLRSIPGQKGLNGAPPASLFEASQTALQPTELVSDQAEKQLELENRGALDIITNLPTQMASQSASAEAVFSKELEANQTPPAEQTRGRFETKPPIQHESVQDSLDSESEDSDSQGWITPSNIMKHQAKESGSVFDPQEEPKTMQVATITSDFAMQNVLLRMNLNLISPSLHRIRQLKAWVLRCHACFDITKDMSKQFCNRCGKPTLLRTSCSTDKDGNFKVHLKKKMQWNSRGDIYSIPKPVSGSANGKTVSGGGKGSWGQGLILAEDQKEYVKAMTDARRKKDKDLMDEDYLPSILSGDRGRNGGRPKVGAGRNINSKKRHK